MTFLQECPVTDIAVRHVLFSLNEKIHDLALHLSNRIQRSGSISRPADLYLLLIGMIMCPSSFQVHRLDQHPDRSLVVKVQFLGSSGAQIDNTAVHKRTAVVHPDDDAASVG